MKVFFYNCLAPNLVAGIVKFYTFIWSFGFIFTVFLSLTVLFFLSCMLNNNQC